MSSTHNPGLSGIASIIKQKNPPDVLETIAHISNDEVHTPPKLANQVLDLLPSHVWTNPDLKFLDPAVKSGVFLREAAKRLMVGLAGAIEDVDARREHILRNMLYGIAITELTALMSRRSLYCSSDATRKKNEAMPENCYSAVIFETPEGNIAFPPTKHDYGPGDKLSKCRVCGASKGDLDGEARFGRENHAYAFIHSEIQEIFGVSMQFDVIIGNPPYQLKDGGHGASASPIYQLFVDKAKALEPKYLSMIIPARWYAGGKGLDDFRAEMISDRSLKELTDFPKLFECFPGVEIKGGVCFFLRDASHNGDCRVRTIIDGSLITEETRDLREGGDVLIRDNRALSIFRKVIAKNAEFLHESVSSRKPFGFGTDEMGTDIRSRSDDLVFVRRGGKGFISRSKVSVNADWIDQWKVFTPMAGDGHGRVPAIVTGTPFVGRPGEACSETYLLVGPVNNSYEAENLSSYLKTRFARLLILLRKNTQHLTKDRFRFVPKMDMSRTWTDADLYAHFGLDKDEIAFIESMIKEMP